MAKSMTMLELNFNEVNARAEAMLMKDLKVRIDEITALAKKAFEEAGPNINLTETSCLDGKVCPDLPKDAEVFQKLRALNDEANVFAAVLRAKQDTSHILTNFAQASQIPEEHLEDVTAEVRNADRYASIGDMIVESEAFNRGVSDRGLTGGGFTIDLPNAAVGAVLRPEAADFKRTAGWPVEVIRSDRVVMSEQTPIQLVDLLPVIRVMSSGYKYMSESTFDNNAAPRAEGDAFAESELSLVEKSVNVESIGTFIPATEEQLADVTAARDYLNARLPFMVRSALDVQLLNGSGTAPSILGFTNTTGIGTTVKTSALTVLDTYLKAKTNIRNEAKVFPSAVLVSPDEMERLLTQKDSDGRYLFGSPFATGMVQSVWGVRLVDNDSLAAASALMGGFNMHSALIVREGVQVRVGTIDKYFIKNMVAVKAHVRACLAVFRPKAFNSITQLSVATS